jgi:hypothetical protein
MDIAPANKTSTERGDEIVGKETKDHRMYQLYTIEEE